MLVFNYGVSLCIRPVDIDLNTSHVNLQHTKKWVEIRCKADLNTSHVNLQHVIACIQRIDCVQFKYISC